MLPDKFLKPGRLRVLKGRGGRTGTSDAVCFRGCANQLEKLADTLLIGQKLEEASAQLVQCLIANLSRYEADCNRHNPWAWQQFSCYLTNCKMFTPAVLPIPFALFQPPFLVALHDSGEMADYHLMGHGATVVGDAMNVGKLGTTAKLRAMLDPGLSEGPRSCGYAFGANCSSRTCQSKFTL